MVSSRALLIQVARLDLEKYLNLPDVRALLGVDSHTAHYHMSDDIINNAFMSTVDAGHQTYYYVANLLERGINVLIVSEKSTVTVPAFRLAVEDRLLPLRLKTAR